MAQPAAQAPSARVRDPVCGMDIDPSTAAATRGDARCAGGDAQPGPQTARVEYLPSAVDLDALIRAVEAAGPYRARPAAAPSEWALDKEAAEQEAEQERECWHLMRKWWFGATVGAPTKVLS